MNEELLSKIETKIKAIITARKFKENTLLGHLFDSKEEFKRILEDKYNDLEKIIEKQNNILELIKLNENKIDSKIRKLNIRYNNLSEIIDYCENKNKLYFNLLRLRTSINKFFKKYLGLKHDILRFDAIKLFEKLNIYFNTDKYKEELHEILKEFEILDMEKNKILKIKDEFFDKLQKSRQNLINFIYDLEKINKLYIRENQYLYVKKYLNRLNIKIKHNKVNDYYNFINEELEENTDLIYKIFKVLIILPNYKSVLNFIKYEEEQELIINFIIEYTIYGSGFEKIINKKNKIKKIKK